MSPKDNNKQVSAAVRILHQKRDASARAIHLKATDGIVSSVTIERKQMSTKTSFKRIALVAASALAIAGFTAVPSNAAPQVVAAASGMYDTTNFYQVVGGQATIEIGFDTNVVATVSSTGVGSVVSATPKAQAGLGWETLTSVTSTGFQHNAIATSAAYGAAIDTVTVVLSSAVAGAQVITVTPLATNGTPGTAITKTITWTAAGTTAAASWSTYLIDTTTATGAADQIVDSTVALKYDKGTAGTIAQKALVVAKLKDGNGNAVSGATVSVSISGPGLINAAADDDGIGSGGTANQRVASVTTVAGGYVIVAISNDGTAGVATVTLTSGTVTTSRSVTFTGSVASYELTSITGAYSVGAAGNTSYNGVDDSATAIGGIKVVGLDSAGGTAVIGTYYVTSSNTAVATVSAASHNLATATNSTAGTSFIGVTGVSAGKSTITVMNGATAALSTVTKTIEIEVTSSTAATVALTLDKASYQPGEPGVLTFTMTNAAGRPVADGAYTVFATGLAANLYVTARADGDNSAWSSGATSVTISGGTAAWDFYAPSVSGDLSFTATTLAVTTATSALATTARGQALSAAATITGGAADANASLALDAANAATDAANNAYDEAQNATQAASDALAAVTALAAQVETLIASVKKLTKAVAKLKK